MSSGDESIDIPDEIEVIAEVEGENDNPIETIETGEAAQNNEDKDSDDEETKKVVKPKRVVRNPQPKLNEQTLRTKKGLTALPKHFKRVKFKGRGHEEQDLNVLMKTYEYWCHRMFPKFPFDACIAKLETLGTKKGTQALLKKIRLGMDIDEKEIVSDEEKEEETPMTEGFVDTFDNRFDQLLSGTNETARPAEPKTTDKQLRPAESETTEEQLERIRQNKLRAESLRRQRLEKIKANAQSQENPTTSFSSRNEISTQGDACLDEEVDFDNISSSANKDSENTVHKKTSRLTDNSSDENDIVSQKSSRPKRTQVISSDDEEMHEDSEKPTNARSTNIDNIRRKLQTLESNDEMEINQKSSRPKRTQVISSDEEEMHVDSEKPTNEGSKNIDSIRKKIQPIESDDEMEINGGLDESRGDNRTGDETRTNAPEEDDEEVDLDNILSIINEYAETLVSKKSDGNGTSLNKSSSDEEEKNGTIDNVNENNYRSIRRKKVQTIESSDEMETNENVSNTSADDIPTKRVDLNTSGTSADNNLKEPFHETVEA